MYPKFIAYAPSGGKASLRMVGEVISGGATDLAQDEAQQYQRAKLMAAAINGGDLTTAKEFLEAAGWACYWEAPPTSGLEERFEMRLPAELKAWLLAHGGATLVRRLILAERDRDEQEEARRNQRTYRYAESPAGPDDLSAMDLRQEAAAASAAGTPWRAYHITIYRPDGHQEAEGAEALYMDGRVGIAWGAEATWGDCPNDSPAALEAAMEDWLNNPTAWEARN